MPPLPLAPESSFQSLLDPHATRAFEEHGIPRLGITLQKITRFFRRRKKVRGADRRSRLYSLVNCKAGSAAYADHGVNAPLRSKSSNAAVKGLGLTAKFEHFAQHGDSPAGGNPGKQFQHGTHRFGIRVVAIVN